MVNALTKTWDFLKGLTITTSGTPSPRGGDPVLSFGRDFSLWNQWWSMNAGDGEIDYASRLGDLSQSSLVMAGIRWVGNTLPEAPLMVKKPGDKEADAEEIPDHPMIDLLRYPNEFYAGDSLWTAFAYSWLISGNVYFIKVRDGAGQVAELWYEPHWSINAVTFERPNVLYSNGVIDRYEIKRGNLWYPVEREDVIHFKDGLDPHDPRYGLSFLGTILRELYGDMAAADFAARLSGGGGVPPFVMTIDPQIDFDSAKAEQLEDMLYRKTAGKQRGRPMVVYGGKAEKLAMTPEEMDVKMLRRLPEERFCAVTGIPAVVLELGAGHDHSIYNNVRQATERAYEAYLIPLQRRIASQLNLQLLPDFEGDESDRYVTHDLSGVRALQEDEDAKAKRLTLYYEKGVMTRAEVRSKAGLDIAEDGSDDVYFVEPGASVEEESEDEFDEELQIKSVPSEDEQEKTIDWFDRNAPAEAKGMLRAKVIKERNGKQR